MSIIDNCVLQSGFNFAKGSFNNYVDKKEGKGSVESPQEFM